MVADLRAARVSSSARDFREFALIAPLLFLLVIGIVEFGQALMVQQVLTNAARDGALLATLESTNISSSPTSIVTSDVNTVLSGSNIASATIAISPGLPVAAGQDVSVTVSVPYMNVTWIPHPWFLGSATLSANCAMRREMRQ